MLETKAKMIGVFHIAQQEQILSKVDCQVQGVFVCLSCVQNVYILVSNKQNRQADNKNRLCRSCKPTDANYVCYIPLPDLTTSVVIS